MNWKFWGKNEINRTIAEKSYLKRMKKHIETPSVEEILKSEEKWSKLHPTYF